MRKLRVHVVNVPIPSVKFQCKSRKHHRAGEIADRDLRAWLLLALPLLSLGSRFAQTARGALGWNRGGMSAAIKNALPGIPVQRPWA